MSRATEFPDEESRLREGSQTDPEGGEEGRERVKLKAPKIPYLGRLGEFYQEVKLEMRKTTWPIFGFYLFGVDWVVTKGFEYLETTINR
jgi:preprotein translocase subunit SecE